MTTTNQSLRQVIIALLDTDEGISQTAYELLCELHAGYGLDDIPGALADGDNGRYFLPIGHDLPDVDDTYLLTFTKNPEKD